MYINLWVDRKSIGSGERGFVLLSQGPRWVTLFYPPKCRAFQFPASALEKAQPVNVDPDRVASLIRDQVTRRERLHQSVSPRATEQALEVLKQMAANPAAATPGEEPTTMETNMARKSTATKTTKKPARRRRASAATVDTKSVVAKAASKRVRYPDETTIRVLKADARPKSKYFQVLKDGMTIAQYIKAVEKIGTDLKSPAQYARTELLYDRDMGAVRLDIPATA